DGGSLGVRGGGICAGNVAPVVNAQESRLREIGVYEGPQGLGSRLRLIPVGGHNDLRFQNRCSDGTKSECLENRRAAPVRCSSWFRREESVKIEDRARVHGLSTMTRRQWRRIGELGDGGSYFARLGERAVDRADFGLREPDAPAFFPSDFGAGKLRGTG